MSQPPLRNRTKDELQKLARKQGVSGYERMKKDELIAALTPPADKAGPDKAGAAKPGAARSSAKPAAPPAAPEKTRPKAAPAAKVPAAKAKPSANGTHPEAKPAPAAKPAPPPAKAPAAKAAKPIPATLPLPPRPTATARPTAKAAGPSTLRVEASISQDKDLSLKTKSGGAVKDRLVLTAPDAHWLHVIWELSLQSVQRAEAALGQDWHSAKPIIRLSDVTSTDTTSTSETPLRDIVVHGGCTHWYIDIPQPPRTYRADIGYLSRRGNFFVLVRSNVLVSPKAGTSEALDDGHRPVDARPGVEDLASGRDLHDDAFRRPFKENAFGSGAILPGKLKKFFFDIDAELIVYGRTDPSAQVTLHNEGVKLRPDGTFTMRFSLPDSRQIIPAVATSSDGMEELTIVLAVERNTKRLDPMIHDLYGDS